MQGRHALPHIFHSEDFAKLMRTVRVGVSVLRVRLLPAVHAVTMAMAKVRGGCEWFGLVRPPPTLTMDVFDLPLVSTLRIIGNMALCPVRVCFGRLEDGFFGVSAASVYISTAFLVTHLRQLNHPNPLVSSSSRHMLVKHAWRFSTQMPCLASHRECDPHRDDHSRRLRLWHELGWEIHVPASWSRLAEPHPMGCATSRRSVSDVHAWMCLGLSEAEASRAGYPMPPPKDNSSLPAILRVSEPIDSPILDLPLTGSWVILHDASLHQSTGHGGGGVVFYNLLTREIKTWHFPIPIAMDNSFQAETYVAWVVLRSTRSGVRWIVVVGDYKDPPSLTFCDSLSYISALLGKRKYDLDDLVDSMIQACRALITEREAGVPLHLYSHVAGTLLDELLDIADEKAKLGAEGACPRVGYLAGLQGAQAVVTRQGRQVHGLRSRLMSDLETWYHARHVPAHPLRHFGQYAEVVCNSGITIEDHTLLLAVRHGVLNTNPAAECVLCTERPDHRACLGSCPMSWLYWLHHTYNLARAVPTIFDAWHLCVPMEVGLLFLYPPGCFALRVVEWALDPSTGSVRGLPDSFPVFSIGHTGDVTTATHRALLGKGISQPMFLAILHTVVQHTAWFCRRDWLTSLPVLPHQLVECWSDSTHQLHLVELLDRHVPLNRFRDMSTVMVCRRVWPEVSVLRALYSEGIFSAHLTRHGAKKRRGSKIPVYVSASVLGTHLVNPPDAGRYLQSPRISATYYITNSPAPHSVRGTAHYTCAWEVGWKGDGVCEFFALWTPVGAPRTSQQYASVMFRLFGTLARALGLQLTRVYRQMALALMG